MVFHEIPDHTRPGFDLDAPCPVRGWPNMVIHATTRESVVPRHIGPLSIKCAFGGSESYHTDRERFAVDDDCYLVLDQGSIYSSEIHSETDVETFCVFFHDDFVRDTLGPLVTPDDRFLETSASDTGSPVRFLERLHEHDQTVTPHLQRIRALTAAGDVDEDRLAAELRRVLAALLEVHRADGRTIENLPVARRSTRLELFERLQRARAYMREHRGRTITIAEIAEVACFSQHHFLRVFRKCFDQTPHQYLTTLRLERARRLLTTTDRSVTDICFEIGFESLGSFSSLFRRHHGRSPEQYRALHFPKNTTFKK